MDLYNASLGGEEPETIELTHEQYEEAKDHFSTVIQRADAARRLAENDDFVALVMEGYLTDEPKRLAELIASGRLNDKVRDDCSRQLVSIGDFRGYMKNIIEQGNFARDEMISLEEARDEAIKAEEAAAG
jgi:hypothetical protein